ncbi:hypothetical protein HBI72_032730 [Parastagonospora nodorum]|nr:hypothetical protein HBH42_085150 [Parastagonospora nodorum]KAH4990097.1 hypothetical protein HBI76_065120 [Parastagonospora nodorum]KAH5277700.1 hypothetical protein HBI72_032730 [Parastagonospora nodorum]KAH6048126.1 hypothetical protein HBI54_065050 [Parastagonospora nodorum]
MHGRTLFLVTSCVLTVFASPVPIDGVKVPDVPTLSRRNTVSVANLFPAVFGMRSIVEAIPNALADIEARGENFLAGGPDTQSVEVSIEERGRRSRWGGPSKRIAEVGIEVRTRNTNGGGLKRSPEVDIEARQRNGKKGGPTLR